MQNLQAVDIVANILASVVVGSVGCCDFCCCCWCCCFTSCFCSCWYCFCPLWNILLGRSGHSILSFLCHLLPFTVAPQEQQWGRRLSTIFRIFRQNVGISIKCVWYNGTCKKSSSASWWCRLTFSSLHLCHQEDRSVRSYLRDREWLEAHSMIRSLWYFLGGGGLIVLRIIFRTIHFRTLLWKYFSGSYISTKFPTKNTILQIKTGKTYWTRRQKLVTDF